MGQIKTIAAELARKVGVATLGHLVGRMINVITPFVVLAMYGANQETDQFFFMMAVAFFFHGTLATALTDASVPLIVSGESCIGRKGWISGGALAALLMSVIAIYTLSQADVLSGVMLLGLVAIAWSGVTGAFAAGTLHAREKFGYPGLLWSFRILPVVIFWLLFPKSEYLAFLVLGIGVADIGRAAILARLSYAVPIESQPAKDTKFQFPKFIQYYSPLVLAVLIMGLNPIIDRLIAGLGEPGSISILEAGERLYGIIASIGTIGLTSVMLTKFSKAFAEGTLESRWSRVVSAVSVWVLVWMIIGMSLGYILLGWLITNYTPLDERQLVEVKQIYWFYLFGLPAFIIGLTYARRLQASHMSWVFIPFAVFSVLANGILSLVFMRLLGIVGIAIATTVIYNLNCLLLMIVTIKVNPRGVTGEAG